MTVLQVIYTCSAADRPTDFSYQTNKSKPGQVNSEFWSSILKLRLKRWTSVCLQHGMISYYTGWK